eukprot:4471841-Karenia_brevis.AAC.1
MRSRICCFSISKLRAWRMTPAGRNEPAASMLRCTDAAPASAPQAVGPLQHARCRIQGVRTPSPCLHPR